MTTNEIYESTFVAATGGSVSLEELLSATGLSRDDVDVLLDFGILEPVRPASSLFRPDALVRARRAARLRTHFDLNASGMALAVDLLQRMDELQARIRYLECQLLK